MGIRNGVKIWNKAISLALFILPYLSNGQETMKTSSPQNTSIMPLKGKFIPPAGKTLFLVGQDVGTIDGYLKDVSPSVAGFMIYTSTANTEGLTESADYGAGESNASHYTDNRKYDNTVLQLGLYMVDDLDNINNGKRDSNIEKIGKWIKSTKRPLYLRIGYEFDGSWNHYDPEAYVKAYRKIVDMFRKMKVENVAYVWASAGAGTYKKHPITDWYPGDDYVDWVGISVFRQFDSSLGTEADMKKLFDFAKTKNLPVGITESTPYGSKGGIPDAKWDSWFKKVFKLIEENDIRMFCYINANWDEQKMWKGQGWGDCRIQNNPKIKENWLKEIGKDRYLGMDKDLFRTLGFVK